MFQINEAAFHNPRLLLDIEAGSPIILIPHSSKTQDVLVADLGKLSVKNCFSFDGDTGTFTAMNDDQCQTPTAERGQNYGQNSQESLSRTSSRTSQKSFSSGVLTNRSVSQTDTSQVGFDELLPRRTTSDPMTDSIYGGLESDLRCDDDIYDPTEDLSETVFKLDTTKAGTSVDMASPGPFARKSVSEADVTGARSKTSLNIPKQGGTFIHPSQSDFLQPCSPSLSVGSNMSTGVTSPPGDCTLDNSRNVFADIVQSPDDEKKAQRCLLDVLEVNLSDMDLFSAERVEKRKYNSSNLSQDLEFPSCVIQRKVKIFFSSFFFRFK